MKHSSSFLFIAAVSRSESVSPVPRAKKFSRSTRAGLKFPVGRILRILKSGNYSRRVGFGAALYLTAVLEYLSAEILELAGNAATDNKRSR